MNKFKYLIAVLIGALIGMPIAQASGAGITFGGGGGSSIISGGSGTLNTVVKFTPDGTHIGNSTITDNGTTVLVTATSLSHPGAGANSENFGVSALSAGLAATAIGNSASSAGQTSTAIGSGALAPSTDSTVIGASAHASSAGGATAQTAVGKGANADGNVATAVGNTATATGGGAVALGQSTASSLYAIAIGYLSSATTGQSAIAIGKSATSAFAGSTTIGESATATAANQFVAGSSVQTITDVYFGSGVSAASPIAYTLHGTSSRAGTDNNTAGANLTIQSGNGTGSSTGSSLIFQTPTAVAGGSGAQTQTTRLTIAAAGTTFADYVSHSAGLAVNSNTQISFTNGGYPILQYLTGQTKDSLAAVLANTSQTMLFVPSTFDFAHGDQADPTIFIHSHNNSTTQWLGLTHDATNGVISVGTGSLSVPQMIVAGVAHTNLGTPADGTMVYCTDCKVTTAFVDQTCISGGSGAFAFRQNGAWKCME